MYRSTCSLNGTCSTCPNGGNVLSGYSAPSPSIGNTCDFYINKTTNQMYGPKVNGNWGAPFNLGGQGGGSGPSPNIPDPLNIGTINISNELTFNPSGLGSADLYYDPNPLDETVIFNMEYGNDNSIIMGVGVEKTTLTLTNPANGARIVMVGKNSLIQMIGDNSLIQLGTTSSINLDNNSTIEFSSGGEIIVDEITLGTSLLPKTGESVDIGATGNRIDNIYCDNLTVTNPVTVSSDRNLKENIEPTDLGLGFINKLNPVKYNFIKNNPEKVHHGLIAQDVRDLLIQENIDPEKFAAYHHNTSETEVDGEHVTSDNYALSYTGFIAPLIKASQELHQITVDQDAKLAALEARLAALESRFGN